ncbi:MAG: hypothetical protein N2037_09275 [Acidimicrobiales bacterium]|nr:hypothetical protein [Acidimicrobiales bacterium]
MGTDPKLADPADFAAAAERFMNLAKPRPGDHVVVAVNPALAFVAHDLFPGARLLVASGPSGADRALCAVADERGIAGFYDGVVIGSGDGRLVDVAEMCHRAGIPVVVIARRAGLHQRLRSLANRVQYVKCRQPDLVR